MTDVEPQESAFLDWLAHAIRSDVPADTIGLAKSCLLDTLGASLPASSQVWCRIVSETVGDNAGGASLWGNGRTVSLRNAALANGTMGHGLELDDVYKPASAHPGSVVIPAAIAFAEAHGASGAALLKAVVLGYEALGRVGRTLPTLMVRGFHGTSANGVFGAVAAGAALLNFDRERLGQAFGISASMASGICQFSQDSTNTMVKRLHAGRAAEGGALAVELAANGFTGPAGALTGRFGYLHMYAAEGEPYLDDLSRDLGGDYVIRERAVKPYPCCAALHPVIEALHALMSNWDGDHRSIAGITIEVSSKVLAQSSGTEVNSIMAAQFSAPFVAAAALFGDPMKPESFDPQLAADERYRSIMNKVRMVENAEYTRRYAQRNSCSVRVEFGDGRLFTKEVEDALGTPLNPMSNADIVRKYHALMDAWAGPARAGEIREAIAALDQADDIGHLCRLLRMPALNA